MLAAFAPRLSAALSPAVVGLDDLVIGCFFEDLSGAVARLPEDLRRQIISFARTERFCGKGREQLVLRFASAPKRRVALVGLGAKNRLNEAVLVRFGGQVSRIGASWHSKKLGLVMPEDITGDEGHLLALGQGLTLGTYRFDDERGHDNTRKAPAELPPKGPVEVAVAHVERSEMRALKVGSLIGNYVCLARDLVNRPANKLFPESFAKLAAKLAKEHKIGCKVLEPRELLRRNMGLLMGVGQGSERLPRLVHLSYRGPKAKSNRAIALVGKGITFDSGGLCIKPSDSMATMKMDMGGAAAVLATMLCIAQLNLPLEVHGVLALAENMPSGTAIRPGDILTSARGITVEVNNTDAEGRLVLADALHYIQGVAKPERIVDVATLTGACMVALGTKTVGLFANDDELADGLLAAAARGGEDFWRLPLTPQLSEQLRSDCADMRNTGERYGGAITAALFLQRFIDEGRAWSHLDIAGPAFGGEDSAHLRKGGSGVAVATLVQWLIRAHKPSGAEVS